MSTPALGAYTFLPWVQRGAARAIAAPDEPDAVLSARATLPVTLHVDGAGDVTKTVRLFGPGDVTGLDVAQVVRTDPPAGTARFEAGYMAQIQFARADLPWLFTPAAPGSAKTRLRPWLVLVTVRRQDGVRLIAASGGPLAILEIANAAAELPDLDQSWAWAHAQIAGLSAGQRPADVLAGDPGRAGSRLVCPRHLTPDTPYLACVVPAFRAGVQAGLGDPVDDAAALDPAWGPSPGAVRLPVYFSWEFSTGPEGSFETLVGRLHPAPLDPASARPPKLDLGAAGEGLPKLPRAVVEVQSALRIPGPDAPPPWPDATRVPFQAKLEGLLTGAVPGTLTAPVYGQLQADADALPPAGTEPAWLRELNLDPRLRIAAAAGTRVVQDRQEQLMARAWEQAGAVSDADALLRRSQLARELSNVLLERHLRPLKSPDFLAMTQPAHAQVMLADRTVDAELHASRVPQAVVSGAMRRLANPQGLIARRAASTGPAPIDLLRAVDTAVMKPPPAPPAGMVVLGASSFAARPLSVGGRPVARRLDVDGRRALTPDSIQDELLVRLAPDATVLARAQARVAAPADTWARPDPLAPLATGPRFPEPMYDGLQQVAPWLFLPGVEHLEADGVALLETTPRVIEAYMAGLNHELSRELLWREFPTALGATAFRQFWDVRGQPGDPEALADIPPLADWGHAPLGGHLRGAGGQLVLLVRGELLRRYPTTTIYAARRTATGALDASTRLAPTFRGALAPDIAFVGFALREENALGLDPAGPGWYFVFEQYPGEPRFGFDEVAASNVPPTTADALAWAHVPVGDSGHADVTRALSAAPNLRAAWGHDAASTAMLTFQQPFRVALPASLLLPTRPEARP